MRWLGRRQRRLVLALADTHGGHMLGLLNPDTVLIQAGDEGEIEEWTPPLTPTQKKLWEFYTEDLAAVEAFAAGDEIVAFHDGDLTHGDHHSSGLIPDTTTEDQRWIAYYNMKPLVELPNVKKVRFLTGTLVHVPDSAEARVAYRLREHYGKDIQAFHHQRADVSGVLFDVAHHGPGPGSRDWLKGNVARYYLRDRIYLDQRLGVKPSRVYLRAHYHEFVHETLNLTWRGRAEKHELIVLPSYAGPGHFVRKVLKSMPSVTNGMVVFEIVGGKLNDIRVFTRTVDLRTEEAL